SGAEHFRDSGAEHYQPTARYRERDSGAEHFRDSGAEHYDLSGEGRRTPPPLPDQDPPSEGRRADSTGSPSEDWLDSPAATSPESKERVAPASETESLSSRSSREARETETRSGSPQSRQRAGGLSGQRAGALSTVRVRVTEQQRSSPSRSGQALVPRRSDPSSRSYRDSGAEHFRDSGAEHYQPTARYRERDSGAEHYERSGSGAYTSPFRSESRYRSDYGRSAASGYTSSYRASGAEHYIGGGGSGIGAGSGGSRGGLSPSGLTVVALVALLAFFGGFAIRNIFAEGGGFDDERPIRAANVPEAFREFCFAYNGIASFTVVELTSVSALTMASVPIYKMDTCTIPVSQTANALQALGIRGRASTLGPQLGGSNLTLIQIPLASSLARAVFNQFPGLADQGNEAQVLSQLETAINNALRSNMEGLALQSVEVTNIPDVYVMVPGHSFNLQPQLKLR
ncbi:MAG: hypothetical protein ACUVRV_05100, partial [Cyanobacteriota bacterium]